MVIEMLLDLLAGMQSWFLGLFGDLEAPAWLSDLGTAIGDVLQNAAGLGAWFPFTLLGVLAGFLLALWLVLWTIKGVRWLWGLTPFSGGS